MDEPGLALGALERLSEAREAYQRSRDIRARIRMPHLEHEAMTGLAAVALMGGELHEALELVEQLLPHLDGMHRGVEEPFWIWLTCFRVLRAHQDARAPPAGNGPPAAPGPGRQDARGGAAALLPVHSHPPDDPGGVAPAKGRTGLAGSGAAAPGDLLVLMTVSPHDEATRTGPDKTTLLFAAVLPLLSVLDVLIFSHVNLEALGVRVLWAGELVLSAFLVTRLSGWSRRLFFLGNSAIGSVFYLVIVACTGDVDSPYVHLVMCLPLLVAIVYPEEAGSAIVSGIVCMLGVGVLVVLTGHPRPRPSPGPPWSR
ncbi:tetratricopeptide repeat protein [Cystobacter fuscus]